MTRHFLALHDYTKDELDGMLALAADLKVKQKSGVPHKLLDGKTVALIFEKSSTRTRVSFEVGRLSAGRSRSVHVVGQLPDGSRRADQG